MKLAFQTTRAAEFSEDRRYRYRLRVTWGTGRRLVNFVMLNPSTADEVANDPTIERCQRRAVAWGFDGLIVTNLFAWRATDPRELRKVSDPYGGAKADDAIINAAHEAELVVCGWGNNGAFEGRSSSARWLIRHRGGVPHYLRLTKAGEPEHPLYIPYSVKPTRWIETEDARAC